MCVFHGPRNSFHKARRIAGLDRLAGHLLLQAAAIDVLVRKEANPLSFAAFDHLHDSRMFE